MKRIVQGFLGVILLAMVISCSTKINCPSFNKDLLSWLPYENMDTIRLINTSTDSILSLVVVENFVEHTTHYYTNLDCGTCDDHLLINRDVLPPEDIQANIHLNKNIIKDQHFLIKGVSFSSSNSEYLEKTDVTFNNKEYDDVWIFTKSGSHEKFNQLILAKAYGIIGLVDLHYNNWVLLETTTKSSKETNIEIHNIACE